MRLFYVQTLQAHNVNRETNYLGKIDQEKDSAIDNVDINVFIS